MQRSATPSLSTLLLVLPDVVAICHEVMLCDNCQVVTERTAWKGGYIAQNAFGFGGSNAHVLLKSPDGELPMRPAHVARTATRLVTCAGRTKEGVEAILSEVLQHSTDVDMQYLLQSSVGDLSPSTHPFRGVALVNSADSRQTVEVRAAEFALLGNSIII